MVLDYLNHHVEQENRQKTSSRSPAYLACQMLVGKFTGRVAERTRPNPKMRRGPKWFACLVNSG
jgi:hypothetical protein